MNEESAKILMPKQVKKAKTELVYTYPKNLKAIQLAPTICNKKYLKASTLSFYFFSKELLLNKLTII